MSSFIAFDCSTHFCFFFLSPVSLDKLKKKGKFVHARCHILFFLISTYSRVAEYCPFFYENPIKFLKKYCRKAEETGGMIEVAAGSLNEEESWYGGAKRKNYSTPNMYSYTEWFIISFRVPGSHQWSFAKCW